MASAAAAGGWRPGFCALSAGWWAWLALPGDGMAQVSGSDPLMLQQLQRGGLGGFNGVVDTTTNQPASQTLQPQLPPINRQEPSRLEQILSARAGMRLQQFGYGQLGNGLQVTVPETGAVQDDYIMGPGDEVVVSLRGQENSDVRTNVDRNGRVVLPRLAPIPAAGRSFGSFRQDVDALVRRAYVASTASMAIGRVRQISVLVSGEVNVPGQRLVTGLSSVVDAILLSGGVKKTGSLRNVRIQRAGHDYVVDLYSVLTGSGAGGTMRLADGDRIVVSPLGPTVAVAGLVRRPGIYELPARAGSMTARALLSLAGGQEVRGRYRLSVQRIEPDGRLNLVALPGDTGVIRDSEILRVELNADLATSQATLSGGVGLAGQYAVTPGTRLSDVIKAPGALGTSPYTLFGLIVRKDPRTLMRSLVAFTPAEVLNGTEDMPLQTDDIIRPITVGESQLLTFVLKIYLGKLALDQDRIRNPLETSAEQAAEAVAIANAQNNNGSNGISRPSVIAITAAPVSPDNPFGLRRGALDEAATGQEDFSNVPADLQRSNIIALLDMAAPGTLLAQQHQLAYQQSLQTANSTGVQTPAQAAQAQQAALFASQTGTQSNSLYGQQQTGMNGVTPDVNGLPTQVGPGGLPVQPLAPNYEDQPIKPGDYATNREARTFGELSRQLEMDPLVLVNFLIDHRARLDGAVRGPGSYSSGRAFPSPILFRRPAAPSAGPTKAASNFSPPSSIAAMDAPPASARPCRCTKEPWPAMSCARAISCISTRSSPIPASVRSPSRAKCASPATIPSRAANISPTC